MPRQGKRYLSLQEKVDRNRTYSASEAAELVKELATAKFDETVEVHFRLGIDPTKSEQSVRGTVSLPHGTGKTIRVLAIVQAEQVADAEEAGADMAGGEEIIEKILSGWMEFAAVVATPNMMGQIGSKLGRILGPRGLLPNPKSGTVGTNVGEIVGQLKAGRIEFRSDKTGVVHAAIGKASFAPEKLAENLETLRTALEAVKPEGSRGIFLRTAYVSSTMGPSVRVTV